MKNTPRLIEFNKRRSLVVIALTASWQTSGAVVGKTLTHKFLACFSDETGRHLQVCTKVGIHASLSPM